MTLAIGLQVSDHLLGGNGGFRLRRVVFGRHKASSCPAPDQKSRMCKRCYSRSPIPRTALVGHDRKLGFISHNGPRAKDLAPTVPSCQRLWGLAGVRSTAPTMAGKRHDTARKRSSACLLLGVKRTPWVHCGNDAKDPDRTSRWL